MPYVQNFSASQVSGFPGLIYLTNSSTGTDAAITALRAYFITAESTYLVVSGTTTDYNAWPLASTTKSFDVLPGQDYSLNIKVDWVDVSGNVLYTKTILYCFTMYSKTFYYGLTQNQTSDPNIVNDTNYYNNKMKLKCSIDEAISAVDDASDIYSSQSALNRAQELISNQNDYF